jgi:hypothetical protein
MFEQQRESATARGPPGLATEAPARAQNRASAHALQAIILALRQSAAFSGGFITKN